jgi:hypothetical protein
MLEVKFIHQSLGEVVKSGVQDFAQFSLVWIQTILVTI